MAIPTVHLGSSADSRVGVIWSTSAATRKVVSDLSADQAKLFRRFKKLTMRSHICRPISFTIIGFYDNQIAQSRRHQTPANGVEVRRRYPGRIS